MADLLSVALQIADGKKKSASALADLPAYPLCTSHHRRRGVPTEWVEVQTDFGSRYVRLVISERGKGISPRRMSLREVTCDLIHWITSRDADSDPVDHLSR